MAQYNFTVGDFVGNGERILEGIRRAHAEGCDLVAFPELALSGYPPEDLVFRSSFGRENRFHLERIAAACPPELVAVVGYVKGSGRDAYNAAAVIHDGRIWSQDKKLLPTYSVFDEDRYFSPAGEHYLFTVRGIQVGVTICEDIWFANGPARLLASRGAEVILNISASPYHTGKGFYRREMLADRARDNGVAVAYLNLVGGQDELVFDGQSLVFDAAGELMVQGRDFAEDFLTVDLEADNGARRRWGGTFGGEGAGETPVYRVVFSAAAPKSGTAPSVPPPTQNSKEDEQEDDVALDYRALVLGLADYVNKNGFERVIVGLSGGIDSALTATIAADALGPERVLGVSMPSPYSSRGSREDARKLAANLEIDCRILPINRVFGAYRRVLKRLFRGYREDVTEENLQARIRGNLLMALSNKYSRHLVISTSNKSEAAVGYTTLYGDMAGGFAVLKDVYKTRVYQLARHRNRLSPVIPDASLTKPPSAELRPGQTDQDSLPPYELLDAILRAYIEEDASVEEIVAGGHPSDVVARVVRLVDASEYKRRQAPVGLKITPKAFGRDRRIPITNRYRG